MIVLHAVTPALADEADTEGLRRHTTGTLTVLYDESPEPPALDQDAVASHGARLLRLAQRSPLLPMRYGTVTASLAELDAVVGEHAAAWRRQLAQVEGHCELLVHVEALDADREPRGESGADYLRRRAEVLHRQAQRFVELEGVLDECARALRLLPDNRRLAVLVRRELTDRVRETAAAWARSRPDVSVAVTGPWPPFSFCDEEGQS